MRRYPTHARHVYDIGLSTLVYEIHFSYNFTERSSAKRATIDGKSVCDLVCPHHIVLKFSKIMKRPLA